MSRYAIVVVVEADDAADAWDEVAATPFDNREFVGHPWSLPKAADDAAYGVTSVQMTIDGMPVELWPAPMEER